MWGLQPDQPSKLPWHLRHASRYTTALSCCGPATLGIWVALWIRPGEGALTLIVVRGHAVFKTPLSVIFFSSEDPPFHFQALFKLQSLRARIRDPTSIFRNIYIVKPNFCCFSVPETLLMKTWPGWHTCIYVPIKKKLSTPGGSEQRLSDCHPRFILRLRNWANYIVWNFLLNFDCLLVCLHC